MLCPNCDHELVETGSVLRDRFDDILEYSVTAECPSCSRAYWYIAVYTQVLLYEQDTEEIELEVNHENPDRTGHSDFP
jgi:uncharacterized protein with PIN domain